MSLHVLANHMATKGRNGDSMLVHMTPHEVAGLQALAMKHGGSLTINPDTGLPEASFLKSLLPMIAGFALNAFVPGLGAAVGSAFGGLSAAAGTGIAVGGITGLATGSLSKGLMAGLGAYGGAGLGEGLASAGAASGAGQTLATEAASQAALEGIQLPSDYASLAAKTATPDQIAAARAASTSSDLLSAGAKSAAADPMAFAKANLKPLAAAAAPIAADMMVPTTTKMPENKNPAYIRQKSFDPISQTYTTLTPVRADEWGARSFSDAYAKPMAGGGIVALADGGTPPAYTQYSSEEIGKYLAANPNVDIAAATKQFNADPAVVNQYISGLAAGYTDPTATAGGSGTLGIYNKMQAAGIDPNELYAAQPTGWSTEDIAKQYNFDKGALALAAAQPKGVSDKDWANYMDTNKYSVLDAAKAFGLSTDEVQRRYDAAKKAAAGAPPAGYYGNNAGIPALTTPGDIAANKDGTVTVQPNIPGRPTGGFSGMTEVKDTYTRGGGSLGYTPYIPTTPEEHDKLYNTQGSDSLAAYNYLIGKGAGTAEAAKYPVKSGVGEIMRPYKEATLGVPADLTTKKYLWDAATKTYKLNPDYKAPQSQADKTAAAATAAKAGKASSISVVDSSGYDNQTITAVLQDDGTYLGSNNKRYDASGKELAAMGGVMGYAVGGGLGSLGSYSDGGRLLRGPGDGVSDSIPATIGAKQQPARLADGEFVVPARIVSELGNGSTEAGAKKLYAMMDRVQRARGKTTGKNKVAANTRADKYLPA